ncbi:MAG TPA: DUF2630 family protein [Acidimicrobiales bacterium]|jgi:hypothetical protein|nr:DUF2630 family protein [Acidimicrobiales bacterium]
MDDRDIYDRISKLVDEEHTLFGRHGQGEGLTNDEEQRLRDLEVNLDQCWDLLRQRRARRHAGESPDDASVRDADTVEHYQQ